MKMLTMVVVPEMFDDFAGDAGLRSTPKPRGASLEWAILGSWRRAR